MPKESEKKAQRTYIAIPCYATLSCIIAMNINERRPNLKCIFPQFSGGFSKVPPCSPRDSWCNGRMSWTFGPSSRFDAWTNERGRSWRFGKAPTFWVVIQSVGFGYLLYDAVWILFFGYRNIYCEFYHVNLVVWCHLSSEGKSCSRDSIELVFGGAYAARSFWAHFDLNQPQTSLQMVVHLRKDSEGT